jgi:hypothetical protein
MPVVELLVAGGIDAADGTRSARAGTRDRRVGDRPILRERVADLDAGGVDDADDVARQRGVDRLALLAEQLVRVAQRQPPAGALVEGGHAALEAPAADAHERHAIAVARIGVGLDLEDLRAELAVERRRAAIGRGPSRRLRREPRESARGAATARRW